MSELVASMDASPRRILIVAGGTGGHIAPALAVGAQLRATYGTDVAVRFVSGSREIEKRLFAAAGEFPDALACERSPRMSPTALPLWWALAKSQLQAWRVVSSWKPHAVLAMGGYVCAPVLNAALLRGVPYFLHESNAIPGRVTRWFAPRASTVFVAHKAAAEELPKNTRTRISGTPVRAELVDVPRRDARRRLGIANQRNVLLVLGGSQGARTLNDALLEALPLLDPAFASTGGLSVLWSCGPQHAQPMQAAAAARGLRNIEVRTYETITAMGDAYAASDGVLSRAGASTLAELTTLGLPSLLVPYPHAADNHQVANADALAREGAAIVREEAFLTGGTLARDLAVMLLDPEVRRAMARGAASLGCREATTILADALFAAAVPPTKSTPSSSPATPNSAPLET